MARHSTGSDFEHADGPSIGNRKLPFQLGAYLVVEELGRGGMGTVFLARQEAGLGDVGKICVLKTLRSDHSGDEEYARRFIDEARVVVRLSHRNIVPVFEVGRAGPRFFLAMEYVPGLNLTELAMKLARAGKPLPPAIALYVIGEVLEALEYAHRLEDARTGEPLNLVHRDVTPQNVLVSFEGEVKLIDFGLARSTLKVEKTAPRIVMGKAAYMSPEQARGLTVDKRTDLFATAVVLYELLVGRRYYEGVAPKEMMSIAARGSHTPAPLEQLVPSLQALIRQGTETDPDQRFADADAFHEALATARDVLNANASARDLRKLLEEVCPEERARSQAKVRHHLQAREVKVAAPDEPTQHIALSELHPSKVRSTDSGGVAQSTDSGEPADAATAFDERTEYVPHPDDDPAGIFEDVLSDPEAPARIADLDRMARTQPGSGPNARGTSGSHPAVIVRGRTDPSVLMPPPSRLRQGLIAGGAAGGIILLGAIGLIVFVGSSDGDRAAVPAEAAASDGAPTDGEGGAVGAALPGPGAPMAPDDRVDAAVDDADTEAAAEPAPAPEPAASKPAGDHRKPSSRTKERRRPKKRTSSSSSPTTQERKAPPKNPSPVKARRYLREACADVPCSKPLLGRFSDMLRPDQSDAAVAAYSKELKACVKTCAATPRRSSSR